MNAAPTTSKRKVAVTAATLARWLLGALFIYMGLSKAVFHDPADFLKLVRQYNMVTSPLLLNSIAAALPWFEVFCGLLLLLGVAVRGAALAILVMLLVFTPLVARRGAALSAEKKIPFCAVRVDCGCGAGEVNVCGKIAENSACALVSCWLVLRSRGRLCARFALLKAAQPAPLPAGEHA
jgi:uncharacterized membrane protein YphA (DoxX/SURF4 family)